MAKSGTLMAAGDMLRAEGTTIRAKGTTLWAEGATLWAEGVRAAYGNVTIEWKSDTSCLIDGTDEFKEEP